MAHYYERTENGIEPRHFVEMASRPGELRPTRITDVRKWWREGRFVPPSVTTVKDVLAKHALTNWLIDQHLEVAADIQRGEQDVDSWIRSVKTECEKRRAVAPSAGTDFHKAMETWFTDAAALSDSEQELCDKVHSVIAKETGIAQPIPVNTEYNFISNLGYSGQIDLLIPGWLIDYKTKQTAAKFKLGKMAYDDHLMQLAAYRVGIGLPHARCANVFVCLETGDVDFHEHSEPDLQRGWEMFKCALKIWQIQNDFPMELLEKAA